MFDLYKEKGPLNEAPSYRDILLANEVGNTLQSSVRPVLNEQIQDDTVSTQWGSGLNNGSTEAAHLFTKATIDIANNKSASLGLVCLDV